MHLPPEQTNLFMLCSHVTPAAFSDLPPGFCVRFCRPDELDMWISMQNEEAPAYLRAYSERVYAPQGDVFFRRCLFLCDENGLPAGACLTWRAYGAVTTLHWFKIIPAYEGRGLGRALLSEVLRRIPPAELPILLHTQLSSLRAIKLYADFGFSLLTDAQIGLRANGLAHCLPYLKKDMPAQVFGSLRFESAPPELLDLLARQQTNEF